MNYQNRGLSHLPKPKAEADKTNVRFGNSSDFSKCIITMMITLMDHSPNENL